MSYLAIGEVTRAITELLSKKLNKPQLMGSGSLKVTALPPDDDRIGTSDGLNLFLYKVTENPYAKNMDWSRDRNGGGTNHPPLSLTLHYLMTAYAKKSTGLQDEITSHHLLGNGMLILHENPVINDVHDSDFDSDLDTQFAAELRDAYEKIKISLVSVSMDELSKIWTGLSKAYRLSAAYEVSLLQIASLAPAEVPSPGVQQTGVKAGTSGRPLIVSVEPASGPAGAQVILKGKKFKSGGMNTRVSIGDSVLEESDLLKLTDEEIVLTIPEVVRFGPSVKISVSTGGFESEPAEYRIEPWISSVRPLRGITGIPVSIPYDADPSAVPEIEIDGSAAAVSYDPENRIISAVVPGSIASNGPKSVVLIAGGTDRSNTLFYDVMPVIRSVDSVYTPSPEKTVLTVIGDRLNGKDVALRYGKLLLKKGENSAQDKIVIEVRRKLLDGQTVSAIVDGRESNPLPPYIERIEPAAGYPGNRIRIFGSGLSGTNVKVEFGAEIVSLGPQPFASVVEVTVPTMAAGTLMVRAEVDGNYTNEKSFEVSG